MVAIGIDLGTTNSCIAIVKGGKPIIITNDNRQRTTPSVVSIFDKEIKVGSDAKSLICKNTENVVYGVKHLIGRKFTDKNVENKIKEFQYSVVNYENKIKIFINNENYAPEEICAYLLKYLKKCAEHELNETVDKAVITVPAYFNDSQRQATSNAGKLAGFEEIKLLDEPTAAAIAYGVENEYKDGRTILVYDFGGGTFDVSIIQYQNNDYKVIGLAGDLNLGGDNIDTLIINHFKEKISSLNESITWNSRNMARLRKQAESVKITLAESTCTDVDLGMFQNPDDDEEECMEFTVDTLNELSSDLFKKTIAKIEECLASNKTNITKEQINSILLVGGSTRLLGVKSILTKYFNQEIKKNINPDEAVALGAAIVAAKWEGRAFQDLSINMINAYSLGVRVKGDKMSIIIPKHSTIPIEKEKQYRTVPIGNPKTTINIFSGENENTNENNFLAQLVVDGISTGPKGTMITVTFCIDEDGILQVKTVDQNGKSTHLDINLDKGNLSTAEIEELIDRIENKIKVSDMYVKTKIEEYEKMK